MAVFFILAAAFLSLLPCRALAVVSFDGSLGQKGALAGPNYVTSSDAGQATGGIITVDAGTLDITDGSTLRSISSGSSKGPEMCGKRKEGGSFIISGQDSLPASPEGLIPSVPE